MELEKFEKKLASDPEGCARAIYAELQSKIKENAQLREKLDPILVEPAIIKTLMVPAAPETAERLQAGAMLTVIDGYDRRIQRDPYIEVVTSALELHGYLGRLSIAAAVKDMMNRNTLTPAKIDRAVSELTTFAEGERAKILTTMNKIIQCPTSEDKIS